jgi:peptidoglycan hydrolase CwlO-like protein
MKPISDKRVVILTVLLAIAVLFGLGERSFVVARYSQSTDTVATMSQQLMQTRKEVQDLRNEVNDDRIELKNARQEMDYRAQELTHARKEMGDARAEIQKLITSR